MKEFLRINVDICVKWMDEFKNLVPVLWRFHIANCFSHSIRNLLKVVGLMIGTVVFGVKAVESIFALSHYVHSFCATLILPGRIFKTGSIYDIGKHRIGSRNHRIP